MRRDWVNVDVKATHSWLRVWTAPFNHRSSSLEIFCHEFMEGISSIYGFDSQVNKSRHEEAQQNHGEPQHWQCPPLRLCVGGYDEKVKCNGCHSEGIAPLILQGWDSFQKTEDGTPNYNSENLCSSCTFSFSKIHILKAILHRNHRCIHNAKTWHPLP